jgi:hypothetical protein
MPITRNVLSEAADKAVATTLKAGAWEVWPAYALAGPLNDPSAPKYVRARSASLEVDKVERYAPLIMYPDLFLKFARLADNGGLDEKPDTEKNVAVALAWTHAYGALGLTQAEDPGRLKADTRGGPGDTIETFVDEAWIAHGALALYEAATAPDGPDVEEISSYMAPRDQDFFTETPAKSREWAMNTVAGVVQEKVGLSVYPALYPKPGGGYVQGWNFMSLLGAMWLQAFWLLSTDQDQRRRCKWCNGVIAFEQPEQPKSGGLKRNDRSGGYRTRRDKQFCSDKCRNEHWRQNNPRR